MLTTEAIVIVVDCIAITCSVLHGVLHGVGDSVATSGLCVGFGRIYQLCVTCQWNVATM